MHDQTHGELHFSLRVFKVELVLDYLDYLILLGSL